MEKISVISLVVHFNLMTFVFSTAHRLVAMYKGAHSIIP